MKVSIILPCYNVEKFISKCIDSITSQTYKELEIICVNDCSTDSTVEIIKNYQRQFSNIYLVDLPQNKGVYNTRIEGIRKATGQFIAFIDSDDYIKSDYIEVLVREILMYNTDIVCISGYYTAFKFFKIKRHSLRKGFTGTTVKNIQESEFRRTFFGQNYFPTSCCGKLYRKDVIADVPNFSMFYQEDVIFNMHVCCKPISIRYIDYNGYYYRYGGNSSRANGFMNDIRTNYYIKKGMIDNFALPEDETNKFLGLELKNCFYEYVIRLILNHNNHLEITKAVADELNNDIYNHLNNIDNVPFCDIEDINAILSKDYSLIITRARHKIPIKRKILHRIGKYL